jgi:hypothetical protein
MLSVKGLSTLDVKLQESFEEVGMGSKSSLLEAIISLLKRAW